MSEKEINEAVDAEIVEDADLTSDSAAQPAEKPPSQKTGKIAIIIAILSLILTILVILAAIYFYKQNQQLTMVQQENIAQLNSQLQAEKTALQTFSQESATLNSRLQSQVEQTNLQLQKISNASKLYQTDLQALQRALAETNVRHPNDWILAEVEFLSRLAGRKIWLERDIPSAIALLLAADQRIVELSDPSLSVLRSAFLEDMNTLEALPNRDPDGLVLALSALERRIDKLVVLGTEVTLSSSEQPEKLSGDINDWKKNLNASWSDFVNSFIVINKRDSKLEALLSPEQRWYLLENVRHALAKAELAVYREQQDVYDQALTSVLDLLDNYYDLADSATAHFYQAVADLGKRQIAVDYPDQLKSAPILQRIIEQRIQKSLASSRVEQE